MRPLDEIHAQADRIEDAYETIGRALLDVPDAEGWRVALGFVEGASRRGWELRKAMLNEAVRRSHEHEWEENNDDESERRS